MMVGKKLLIYALLTLTTLSLTAGAVFYVQKLREENRALRLREDTLLRSLQASIMIAEDKERKLRIIEEHARKLSSLIKERTDELRKMEEMFLTLRPLPTLSPQEQAEVVRSINHALTPLMRMETTPTPHNTQGAPRTVSSSTTPQPEPVGRE